MERHFRIADGIRSQGDTMLVGFQDYAERIRPLVDADFRSHLDGLLVSNGPSHAGMEKGILTGGKRVRGALLCLVASALDGAIEEALPRAVAVELIQTATLIHDDFIDQHRMRRGYPAVWTVEGARKAVLLGDIIFASAIRMMSELGREDGLIASKVIAEVSRGAYHEPLDSSSLIAVAEGSDNEIAALYEKIIYLKTGVLFASACRLGAIAARADAERLQRWYGYGLKIGEAYQVADDLHEIEQCLVTGRVSVSEMSSVAPSLLFFVKESRPHILEVLREGPAAPGTQLLKHLESAAVSMKAEIERRLRSALLSIEGDLPDNVYGRLVHRAPWDIIAMFDEARARVSQR